MQELVSHVDDNHVFDIEIHLDNHVGVLPNPFPGMDKSTSALCNFHLRGYCQRESMCPNRHIRGDRTVVCKHWLRGLCKKGDDCEFLHEYDMSKMPECYFYQKFGTCLNKECPFQHIDPSAKIKDCPWYDRGFCRHGPACRHRHTRRVLCINYLVGFCPEGPTCKFAHPSFDLPTIDPIQKMQRQNVVCHACGEPGHKSYNCPKNPQPGMPMMAGLQVNSTGPKPVDMDQSTDSGMAQSDGQADPSANFFAKLNQTKGNNPRGYYNGPQKDISNITCYKCGELGHFANRCPKGYLGSMHLRMQQESQNS